MCSDPVFENEILQASYLSELGAAVVDGVGQQLNFECSLDAAMRGAVENQESILAPNDLFGYIYQLLVIYICIYIY